jgi:hypothetical protein
MIASGKGNLETVKLLVEKDADVNAVSSNKYSALFFAAKANKFETVRYLVENGADVNTADDINKTTALMIASEKGNLEMVKFLVENGADVNAKDQDSKTAAYISIEKNFKVITEFLYENGAKDVKETEQQIKAKNRDEKKFEQNEKILNGMRIFGYLSLSILPATNLIWAPYWLSMRSLEYLLIIPIPINSILFSTAGYFGLIPLLFGVSIINKNNSEAMQDITAGIILLSVGEGVSYLINLICAIVSLSNGGGFDFSYNYKNLNKSSIQFALNFKPDILKSKYDIDLALAVKL